VIPSQMIRWDHLLENIFLEVVKDAAAVTRKVDLEVVKVVIGKLFVCWVLYLLYLMEDEMVEVEQ